MKYTDESGELFGIDDLIAGTIGGIINLTVNIVEGNIDGNFWEVVGKGSAAFGSGFAAGALATYGPAGWAAGGAIIGSTNAWLSGSDPVQGAIMGGVTGLIGGTIGQYIGKGLTVMIGSANISSPVLNGFLGGGFGGGTTGAILNFSISLASGSSFDDALKQSGNGFVSGFITGSVAGAGGAYANAKTQGLNPWTGKAVAAKGGTGGVNRIYSARELLRRTAEPGPFHNFPESFNQTIFSQGTKTITPNFFRVGKPGLSNTGIMYELPGTINGTNGVFQIGVRPSVSGNTELIMHRFFKPY
ncbi:hypothetical protein E6C50_11630 [Flavobacterium supellecticarium]|uniref:Uncharacterized protein n=1 Tax=Flavobacterium supellecticarium TaxID=2565924 RepID=A0A4S3ZUR8_9FLAO|nr:hypothetical protein [Flavobacterium supellecticarium]THF49395.1 hypothetical protein E6C50_11630 [Flavobacterium supellecticarium]